MATSQRPSTWRLTWLDLLIEMKRGLEGCHLLQQPLRQLAAGAVRQARNVVNGLVGVELDALAASLVQHIDHLGMNALQAELKHLKQAHRPGPDDQRVGVDERGVGQACCVD